MATGDTSTYEIDSVVRGHHVYKTIWTPVLSETLEVEQEVDNEHDDHAVAVVRRGSIVGHVPVEISRVCYYFLNHGSISCTVTGHRKKGKGLVVPCIYSFCGSSKNIKKLCSLLAQCKSQSEELC